MDCKNVAQVQKHLNTVLHKALQITTFIGIRDVMLEHIEEDVYGAYGPTTYYRREFDGGLGDPSYIIDMVEDTPYGVTLTVEDIAFADEYYTWDGETKTSRNYGKKLTPIIETGGGDFGYDIIREMKKAKIKPKDGYGSYSEPRPFIANTRKELRDRDLIPAYIKHYLRSQGLIVK